MQDAFRPSAYANLEELKYRDSVQSEQDTPAGLLRKIRASGRLELLPYLRQHRIVEPSGAVLEIGAGSGWLSAELSKLTRVDTVTTLDFSEWLVSTVMPEIFSALGACTSKIERRRGDFHDLSALGVDRYDWVFADSALHHATDVARVLKEVVAVLRPRGSVVALREPVAPIFSWHLRRRRAGTADTLKAHGVEEPLYARSEWEQFFAAAGLRLEWNGIFLSSGIRRIVAQALNGITKADYCLLGRKP
jgi:2-polyprenyl-3-methyl-5-hydroxy-6-metoxy-1,4-benzoquinol methylase